VTGSQAGWVRGERAVKWLEQFAKCENAFWGAEVHGRQLTPEGMAIQDGNA
jgi:hypothetical protein